MFLGNKHGFEVGDKVIIDHPGTSRHSKLATIVRFGIWDICIEVEGDPYPLWYPPSILKKVAAPPKTATVFDASGEYRGPTAHVEVPPAPILSDFKAGDKVVVNYRTSNYHGKEGTVERLGESLVNISLHDYPSSLFWYRPQNLKKVEPKKPVECFYEPKPVPPIQYVYMDPVSGRRYEVLPFFTYTWPIPATPPCPLCVRDANSRHSLKNWVARLDGVK
jgi:hypothetical protein